MTQFTFDPTDQEPLYSLREASDDLDNEYQFYPKTLDFIIEANVKNFIDLSKSQIRSLITIIGFELEDEILDAFKDLCDRNMQGKFVKSVIEEPEMTIYCLLQNRIDEFFHLVESAKEEQQLIERNRKCGF